MRAQRFVHSLACAALMPALLMLPASSARAASQPARAAAPSAPASPPEVAKAPPPMPSAQGYSYNPEGRRDPFVSLMRRGTDVLVPGGARPDGVPGLLVSDIALKGIVLSRGTFVAMIQAADTKTYTIRSGDKLFDATVKAITADAVVFVQQVNDPLSLVKQREIRRPLRPTEEGK